MSDPCESASEGNGYCYSNTVAWTASNISNKKMSDPCESAEGNGCSHSNTIDDEIDGSCVCIECGLVLEQLYFHSYKFKEKDVCTEESELNADSKILVFLKDICENAFVVESFVHYSFSYFLQLKKDPAILAKKFKSEEVASYALYETLSRHNVPHTAKEIEHFTGTSCKLLWAIENCLHVTETLNNPQDFAERYCTLLNLDWYNMKMIKGISGNMFGLGDIRPSCVIAAVIFLYCKENNIAMTMKKVCEVCDVSTGNMYKIIKRLPKKYVTNISLLYS